VAAQKSTAWIPLAPATVASVMGLVGVWASIWGNELAIRFGRRRFILAAMIMSAALAALIGFSSALPYAGAAALVLLYAMLIWASSSLTAGSADSAEPGQRGATLAVHSTLGYAGGFLGPLVLGATLDLLGGASAEVGEWHSVTSRWPCLSERSSSCGCARRTLPATAR
jgi:MFS family permease